MCSTSDFDDDEFYSAIYENGHWEWNEKTEGLEFIPDPNVLPEDSWISPPAGAIGAADFKDDIDLVEQQRFKRLFSRKSFEDDVVKLQDIKDIVLHTAPPTFINPSIIHLMHLPGTERFLRALILYHQYYLQVADVMGRRMLDLETKIRTPESNLIEEEYKDNLEDMRLLIAKEYSNFVTGSGDFKKFHHMGSSKASRSISRKGNILFESLIRLSIQIVWLALGRKSFNQIELEMHRLFKTEKFNMIEHKIKSNYIKKLTAQERYILLGSCVQTQRMLKIKSPLMYEINCKKIYDWRLLGLGKIKYPVLGSRLQYLQDALILPESQLSDKHVSVGILGAKRNRFDTMLREIAVPLGGSSSTSMTGRASLAKRSMSRTSRASRVSSMSRKSAVTAFMPEEVIREIVLPPIEYETKQMPAEFPEEYLIQNPCDLNQRRKWMTRATRLAMKRAKKMLYASKNN